MRQNPRRPPGLVVMNLPNKLTLSRFGLTAVFLVAMFSEAPYHESLAFVVFVAAGIALGEALRQTGLFPREIP